MTAARRRRIRSIAAGRSGELGADAAALAVDLVGGRAEALEELRGERERDLALAGEDDVGAGGLEEARLADVRRAGEDVHVRVPRASDAERFLDALERRDR